MITVLLADDHHIVRRGLRILLETDSEIQVVEEAEDGIQALEKISILQPDVLVTDLMMPGLNGLEVVKEVARKKLKTRVLVLSMHDGEANILPSLRNGAAGYVCKDDCADTLLDAIHAVAEGNNYLSPRYNDKHFFERVLEEPEQMDDPWNRLTERERVISQMSAEGQTGLEIAVRLNISPRTVEVHRANAQQKLGFHNQSQLIRYAYQSGLISW